jgi:hypothetical protein
MLRTLALILLLAISKINIAQECGGYLLFKKNATVQYSVTGGPEPTITYQTTAVVSDTSGCSTSIIYRIPIGKNGKKSLENTWQALYQNNTLKIPLSSLLPLGAGDFEGKKKKDDKPAEEVYIEYPSTMEIDQQFENISTSKTGSSAYGGVSARITVINREVEAKEKVTTNAGTWDCFKIKAEYKVKITYDKIDWKTSDTELKYTLIEWFSPGVGVVKSQTTVMGQTMTAVLASVTSN